MLKLIQHQTSRKPIRYWFEFTTGPRQRLISRSWRDKKAMRKWLIALVKSVQADRFDVYDFTSPERAGSPVSAKGTQRKRPKKGA